jgi:hypothetical protein
MQDVVVWIAVLTCKIHGNVEMRKHIAKGVQNLEPKNSADFVLLSILYAAAAAYRALMRM